MALAAWRWPTEATAASAASLPPRLAHYLFILVVPGIKSKASLTGHTSMPSLHHGYFSTLDWWCVCAHARMCAGKRISMYGKQRAASVWFLRRSLPGFWTGAFNSLHSKMPGQGWSYKQMPSHTQLFFFFSNNLKRLKQQQSPSQAGWYFHHFQSSSPEALSPQINKIDK